MSKKRKQADFGLFPETDADIQTKAKREKIAWEADFEQQLVSLLERELSLFYSGVVNYRDTAFTEKCWQLKRIMELNELVWRQNDRWTNPADNLSQLEQESNFEQILLVPGFDVTCRDMDRLRLGRLGAEYFFTSVFEPGNLKPIRSTGRDIRLERGAVKKDEFWATTNVTIEPIGHRDWWLRHGSKSRRDCNIWEGWHYIWRHFALLKNYHYIYCAGSLDCGMPLVIKIDKSDRGEPILKIIARQPNVNDTFPDVCRLTFAQRIFC